MSFHADIPEQAKQGIRAHAEADVRGVLSAMRDNFAEHYQDASRGVKDRYAALHRANILDRILTDGPWVNLREGK